ncbi:GreA/GreB family elongation factor [Brevibacillus migulae]|uniref:GreA/GreB family elongation factor n=1 Tax=Brevibacillus migulae TaxID=1644114 RepID=UPI00106E18AA|nr:GreA/GreB family elongation factor [Brevibacillus migulae]
MNHSTHHPLRKRLVEQLVFLDENRFELQDMYAATVPPLDRDQQFFTKYAATVERFLSTFDPLEHASPTHVLIGSQVSIFYEEDFMTDDFTICLPEQSDPDKGYISFMSPVGRQLLLREKDEKVVLLTPNGAIHAVVKSIGFNYSL